MSKILIVDDTMANRELLKAVLSDNDYTLLDADSGKAAMEMVSQDVPDIILIDTRMPAMDDAAGMHASTIAGWMLVVRL